MFLVPIIIFTVSGFGIISLLGVKMYQQSRGIQLPFPAKRDAVEGKIRKFERGVKYKAVVAKNIFGPTSLRKISENTNRYGQQHFNTIKNALTGPGHWLDRNTRNLVSLVRGRQHLVERKEPSSFLRHISHR